MTINRAFFYSEVRKQPFGMALTQSQVGGMEAILNHWEETMPKGDDRWLAYMLATAFHETARTMQAVRETKASSDDKAIQILDKAFYAGKLKWVKKPYWNKGADGKSWLGRGLVQLTHKANYETLGHAIGMDLVADPNRAMDLDVAVRVMFAGMTKGLFTGKKLADFLIGSKTDWKGARKIINGTESDEKVAAYAVYFYRAIAYTTG
jgi:Chitinase class I